MATTVTTLAKALQDLNTFLADQSATFDQIKSDVAALKASLGQISPADQNLIESIEAGIQAGDAKARAFSINQAVPPPVVVPTPGPTATAAIRGQ